MKIFDGAIRLSIIELMLNLQEKIENNFFIFKLYTTFVVQYKTDTIV